MVEKSGAFVQSALPGSSTSLNKAMLRCARNIARWWQVELHERAKGDSSASYPGEVAMHRGLMPIALWLGVREYGGIWRYGGGEGKFGDEEMMGSLGDKRMSTIADALTVYGLCPTAGTTLRPPWYRDCFVEWAEEVVKFGALPDLTQHTTALGAHWCGKRNFPYPYVTERIIGPGVESLGRHVVKERANPAHVYDRMLYPAWGPYRRDEREGQVRVEEAEMEEEDYGDYSPASVE